MPVIIDGIASGISTFLSNCILEHPKAKAASLVVSGTPRIPRAVSLITGGIAKIIVARTPGGFPVPKKAIIGIKYTKAGIVCIKSSIGSAKL